MTFSRAAACALLVFLVGGCGPKVESDKIACGTTMIESLVRDVYPEANTAVVVPSGMCPGHFDLKPSEASAIASAKLILVHPFQKNVMEMAGKGRNKGRLAALQTPDMTIPENYIRGLVEAELALSVIFPDKREAFSKNRERASIETVKAASLYSELREKIRKRRLKAVSSRFQAAFAEWAGFEVVSVFADPDSLSVKAAVEMAKTLSSGRADIVIANATGNHGETANIVMEGITKRRAILSNFPPSTGGYASLFEANMGELKKALHKMEGF